MCVRMQARREEAGYADCWHVHGGWQTVCHGQPRVLAKHCPFVVHRVQVRAPKVLLLLTAAALPRQDALEVWVGAQLMLDVVQEALPTKEQAAGVGDCPSCDAHNHSSAAAKAAQMRKPCCLTLRTHTTG